MNNYDEHVQNLLMTTCWQAWPISEACLCRDLEKIAHMFQKIYTNDSLSTPSYFYKCVQFSLIPNYSDAPKLASNKRKLQINNKFSSINNKVLGKVLGKKLQIFWCFTLVSGNSENIKKNSNTKTHKHKYTLIKMQ